MRTHRRRLVATPGQPDLPLDTDPGSECTLRAAHARCHNAPPFPICEKNPALRICLRNVAAGLARRARQRRST